MIEPVMPSDELLLALSGWAEVPSARVLAKVVLEDFAAVVLDSNGGLGGRTYETIEFFCREGDGAWRDSGDVGPAGDGVTGWHLGYAYACGCSPDAPVSVRSDRGERVVTTAPGGWWIVAEQSDDPCGNGLVAAAAPPQ